MNLNLSGRLSAAMNQTSRWLQVREREMGPGTEGGSTPPTFSIAISREAGANAAPVARAIEQKVGWPVYDRELLQRVAGEMGMRASLVEAVDERQKGWLHECLEGFSSRPEVNEFTYTRHLAEVLVALAARGHCILVGRGAAQILPPATTLRVRLVAPLKDRIAAIQDRRGLSRKEAARWVAATDAERARFVRDHFLMDPNDPSNYDLVLNSARYSAAACADIILEALHLMEASAQARNAPQEVCCGAATT